MASRRVLRVGSRMKFIISQVLLRELKDPRLGFITILHVEPTADFREAKVRFSVLGGQGEISKSTHALENARGYIQKRLASNLKLRNTPVLKFEPAEMGGGIDRIEQLIRRTHEEDRSPSSSPAQEACEASEPEEPPEENTALDRPEDSAPDPAE